VIGHDGYCLEWVIRCLWVLVCVHWERTSCMAAENAGDDIVKSESCAVGVRAAWFDWCFLGFLW